MMREKTIELMEYANLCSDEYGEYCFRLASLYDYRGMMGNEFMRKWVAEVDGHLKNYKENAKTETEKYTVEHEKKWLVWKQ